ncbi:MAG TPA: DUF1684 domain-containing protein [Candidatus Limnocylindrales bacterium]|nr:DUF1684 domain-containing protein [Candidatus Limnocylindrales bacterium]
MTDAHDHERAEHDHAEHQHLEYPDAVGAFRKNKDDFFRTSHESPLPPAERKGFTGLPYYPVDESLVFEGMKLEPYTGSEPVSFQIPTSDNQLRPAERAGIFRFEVNGVPSTLIGYAFEGSKSGSVFLPFLDDTSGTETYGAGRYLDLEPEEAGSYVLDFNLAYHPSCVYDARFSCPLTPAENRLGVRIEAGERLAPS